MSSSVAESVLLYNCFQHKNRSIHCFTATELCFLRDELPNSGDKFPAEVDDAHSVYIGELVKLGDKPHLVTMADCATFHDRCIHSDMTLILLNRCA